MRKNKTETKIEYGMVPVKDLKTERYQRSINVAASRKIAIEYDEKLFGVIIVNKKDNEYFIIDGQHRAVAAGILNIPMVMCEIHHNLSHEDAALLFVKCNKERRKLSAFDYYTGLYEANDPTILDIDDVVTSLSFRVGRGAAANTIQAINSLTNIYEKSGRSMLYYVLKTIKDVWHGDKNSLNSLMIFGVYEFLKCYQHEMRHEKLVAQLMKVEPHVLLREAKSDLSVCNTKKKVALAILKHYNYRLSESSKLPNKLI
jgi:hypothetical protein